MSNKQNDEMFEAFNEIELEQAIGWFEACGFEFVRKGRTSPPNHFKKDGVNYYLANQSVIDCHRDEITPDEPEGGE